MDVIGMLIVVSLSVLDFTTADVFCRRGSYKSEGKCIECAPCPQYGWYTWLQRDCVEAFVDCPALCREPSREWNLDELAGEQICSSFGNYTKDNFTTSMFESTASSITPMTSTLTGTTDSISKNQIVLQGVLIACCVAMLSLSCTIIIGFYKRGYCTKFEHKKELNLNNSLKIIGDPNATMSMPIPERTKKNMKGNLRRKDILGKARDYHVTLSNHRPYTDDSAEENESLTSGYQSNLDSNLTIIKIPDQETAAPIIEPCRKLKSPCAYTIEDVDDTQTEIQLTAIEISSEENPRCALTPLVEPASSMTLTIERNQQLIGADFENVSSNISSQLSQEDDIIAEKRQNQESSNTVRLHKLRQKFKETLQNQTEDEIGKAFSTADFAIGMFDHNGGYLEIPYAAVRLYVPPGALPQDSRQEIYIYLPHDAEDTTPLTSPIVRCGPPGLQFQRNIFGVVLSFPSIHGSSPFEVFTKPSDDDIFRGWTNLSKDAGERCFTDNAGNIHLMLEHFSDFKTEEKTEKGQSTKVGLRLGAFGKPFQPGQKIFELYVCAMDPSFRKTLDFEAARLGYYPLQDSNSALKVDKNDCVRVKLVDLKQGWKFLYKHQYEQTLAVTSDMSAKCHFVLVHESSVDGMTGFLHCRIIAQADEQEVELPIVVLEGWKSAATQGMSMGNTTALSCASRDEKHRFDVPHEHEDEENKMDQAAAFLEEKRRFDVPQGEDEENKMDQAAAFFEEASEKLSPHEVFGKIVFGELNPDISPHLSKAAYFDVCLELNAKRTPPTDWRLLMAELGLDEMRYINGIEDSKEAGAVVVLNLFFCLNRGRAALEKLYNACRKVRLYRAAEIIEKDQPYLRGASSEASYASADSSDLESAQVQPLPDVTHTSAHSLSEMFSSRMVLNPHYSLTNKMTLCQAPDTPHIEINQANVQSQFTSNSLK